jgi:two-component system chemotaxis response regulator CheB
LLESMASSLAGAALGVVLTGMGDDGASGLLKIRQAQGYTIAEEESTAIVYGMPRAAVALGAARETLPLGRIAPRLLELASGVLQ